MKTFIPLEWKPNYPATVGGFLRISASQVGANPHRICEDFIAIKSRPSTKIGEQYIPPRYTPFESFPLGIVKDALSHLVNNDKVVHEFEDLEEIAENAIRNIISSKKNHVEVSTIKWANDALIGLLKAWQQCREVDIANGVDLSEIINIQAFDIDGSNHTEWFAWGIYLSNSDRSIREFRMLKISGAGLTEITPIRVGVICKILVEGVSYAESSWGNSWDPIENILPSPSRVRIRELSALDAGHALLFDFSIAEAQKKFDPVIFSQVNELISGGKQKPGPNCRGCKANTFCPALAKRPGLLGITAYSPWPKSYSPSKFHTFRRCPRQYFLQEELGLKTKREVNSSAQQRGILVHAWLETAHLRIQKCSETDLPSAEEIGLIANQLGWSAADALVAMPYLQQHIKNCPIDDQSQVVTEAAIEALDSDADITVSTRPDLLYTKNNELYWREVKTVANIQDLEKDIYFDVYPQIPLAIRLLVEDCIPTQVSEKLGKYNNKYVELELISPEKTQTIIWDCNQESTREKAWSQLAEQVDNWASETLFPPSPNPPCSWCKVSQWCEFANAEQVNVEIGELKIDLRTGEIIQAPGTTFDSNSKSVAKALGLAASLGESDSNEEEIPF